MSVEAQREMTYEEKCHDLRQKIDGLIKYAGSIKGDSRPEYAKGKREGAIVYTKLQEAKMWTGKILEELGTPFPAELRDEAK